MIIRDHFQNYKRYNIPKAQLIIADIPYNIGINAYGSNPAWYVDGDNANGESNLAGKQFFDTDKDFRPAEFMHFCNRMMKKEPKEKNQAPAMIVFCAFDQQFQLIELAKQYGLNNYINLVFRKNFSAQVLKANMRIVGNAEYGLLLYRDKLPKFRNNGKMIFNIIDWERDSDTEKIHPTQKPVPLLEKLIQIFTDEGDVVIDPVAGSGSTLLAAQNLNRKAYGFEIDKSFHAKAEKMLNEAKQIKEEIQKVGFSKTILEKVQPILFS
jgi:site-specific DNA-methyltransferase (adenine-specific)